MDLTPKQEYWKTHLEAAESFEGSASDYARLHDLDVKKLYVFKTALRKKTEQAAASGFVQVKKLQPSIGGVSSHVLVTLPNGVQLSLSDVEQPGLLERLARL